MGGFSPFPPFTISSFPLSFPQSFQSTDGTLMGAINGVNNTFTMGVQLRKCQAFRNGIEMTQNYDYAWGNNVVVFLAGQIPQPGDVLKVVGWPV